MKNSKALIFVFLALLVLAGCNSNKKKQKAYSSKDVQEALIAYNKRLAEDIHAEIDTFVTNANRVYLKADEGFYYAEMAKGNGKSPIVGSKVSCLISFKLFDGTVCYPEKSDEISQFVVGKHNLSIINKGILKVNEGGQIELVSSPYMGYGLNGDGNKIPPARPYLINITLLKVNNETLK